MRAKVSSDRPLNKITYGMLASFATGIVLWGLRNYAGLDIHNPELIAPVGGLIAGLVGYFVPLEPGEIVVTE